MKLLVQGLSVMNWWSRNRLQSGIGWSRWSEISLSGSYRGRFGLDQEGRLPLEGIDTFKGEGAGAALGTCSQKETLIPGESMRNCVRLANGLQQLGVWFHYFTHYCDSFHPLNDVHVQSLWLYFLIWQARLCRCNPVKGLKIGEYPESSRWASYKHNGLYKREAGDRDREKEIQQWEERIRLIRERDHEPRSAGCL